MDPVDLKFKTKAGHQEVIKASDLLETVMQQIVIGPGGSTGWHSHPGPAVALIKSGELTIKVALKGLAATAGAKAAIEAAGGSVA